MVFKASIPLSGHLHGVEEGGQVLVGVQVVAEDDGVEALFVGLIYKLDVLE